MKAQHCHTGKDSERKAHFVFSIILFNFAIGYVPQKKE